MFRTISIFFLLISIVACGWHLRGTAVLPPSMSLTYIDTSLKTSDLIRELRRNLAAAGIAFADSPDAATAVLRVTSNSGRNILSIGPDGRAVEYEVYASATFSVATVEGKFTLEQQRINLSRDLVFDPLDVLAVNREQLILQRDMEKQLANIIIDRITAEYARQMLASQEEGATPTQNQGSMQNEPTENKKIIE